MQRLLSRAALLILSLAVLAPAVLYVPLPAAAQKPLKKLNSDEDKRQTAADVDPRDKARQLVAEGTAALAAHELGAAAQALSAAYKLSPTPGTLFQLGLVAYAQGRIVKAQDLMRRYLYDLTEPEQSAAVKEAQRIVALPGEPSGEVSVVGDPNALVVVDDQVVGVLPLPLPLLLPIGEHRVAVERDALRLEDGVTVKAGRTAEVRCQFHPGVLVVTLAPALLVLTDHPALSGAPVERLEQEVRQAAGLAHLALLKPKEALLQAPKLASCLSTMRCQLELATQNLVQYVLALTAVAQVGNAADWQLKVVLLDATVGDVAAELQKECPRCSAERAAALLTRLVAAVLQQGLHRPRGTLEIESTPVGAEVTSGQRSLGVTPLRRSHWAGPLVLTIRHPGFRTQNASLTVQAGQTTSLKLTLLPGSERVLLQLAVLPRPRWRLGVGTAMLGVGAAVIGLGISGLLAREYCLPLMPTGMYCPSTYLTRGTGSGVIVGGALLLSGGVTLLALPGTRRQVAVAPTLLAGGVGGQVGWQF